LFTSVDGLDKVGPFVVVVSGGPGCGKSRLMEELPSLLRQRAEQGSKTAPDTSDECRDFLLQLFHSDNHVQLQTTLSNGTSLSAEEMSRSGQRLVSARALYSAFCPAKDSFDVFVNDVAKHVEPFTLSCVVSLIAQQRHDDGLSTQRPLFVTYAIDEAQGLVVSGGGSLGDTQ
jgi:hypothetical protein